MTALPRQLQQALDKLILPALEEVAPAVSLAVMVRGGLVIEQAWGQIDPDTRSFPTQPETLFDLASITKLFTTTAFLSLVSQGRGLVDNRLAAILPEFGRYAPRSIDGGQDPHTKQQLPTPPERIGQRVDPALVTIRHLLTHTSGLPAWRDVYKVAGMPPEAPPAMDFFPRDLRWQKALQALYSYPFVAQPGERFLYSDIGLMLLGEAVARLHSGALRLDTAIAERVTQPLGLMDVLFDPLRNGFYREQIAPTEIDPTWRRRRVWGEVHDENAAGVGGVAGHAGLFGSARSLAAFGQTWLSSPHMLGISVSLRDQAIREQVTTGNDRRGLGWMLKSVEGSSAGDLFAPESFGHTGFTGTSLWVDPQARMVVACLTNAVYYGRARYFVDSPAAIYRFRRALHDLLWRELVG